MRPHDVQNQMRHAWLGEGFGTGINTSRLENNRNGRAVGIAKSKPCAIFASGKS